MSNSFASPPATTNLLGDALADSQREFRRLVALVDQLIDQGRVDDARAQLPKIETLAKELRRLLQPTDAVDRKKRESIDREVRRLQRALRKGWGSAVGTGLVALIVGGALGAIALVMLLWYLI